MKSHKPLTVTLEPDPLHGWADESGASFALSSRCSVIGLTLIQPAEAFASAHVRTIEELSSPEPAGDCRLLDGKL